MFHVINPNITVIYTYSSQFIPPHSNSKTQFIQYENNIYFLFIGNTIHFVWVISY